MNHTPQDVFVSEDLLGGEDDSLEELLSTERDVLLRMAKEVAFLYQEYPKLRNSITDLATAQNYLKSRVDRLESPKFDSTKQLVPKSFETRFEGLEWDQEESKSGLHDVLHVKVPKGSFREELELVEREKRVERIDGILKFIGKHVKKGGGHVITFLVGGSIFWLIHHFLHFTP